MDLHHPAVFVCQRQMLMGQEVVNTDLIAGDIAGRKLQVHLQALEAGIRQHCPFHRLSTLAGVRDVQGREIVLVSAFRHVSIVLLQINGDHRLTVQYGDRLFIREQQGIGAFRSSTELLWATMLGHTQLRLALSSQK